MGIAEYLRKIFRLDGGMREKGDNNADNEPFSIINMEYKDPSFLTKRLDPSEFDADLNTLMATLYGLASTGDIKKLAYSLWFPAKMPIENSGEYKFLIPVYGYDSAYHKLYTFYKTAMGWSFGNNIAHDGNFTDATVITWTLGANWVIADNLCTHSSGSVEAISQANVLEIGSIYWTIFIVSGLTGGDVTLNLGTQPLTTRDANGYFIEEHTCAGNEILSLVPSNDFVGSVSKVLVIKGDGATQGLSDAEVIYTASSDPWFDSGSRWLSVVDGINRAHYVRINPEGYFVAGIMRIAQPVTKPILSDYNPEENGDYFEETAADGYIEVTGLAQILYTIETKDGDESNPSPVSHSADMQWHELDPTTKEMARWIKKLTVSNVYVPDGVNEDVLAEMEYFNFYVRFSDYSSGVGVEDFYLIQQVVITTKTGENTYNLSGSIGTTRVSYSNDPAPIAANVSEVDGVIAVSNLKLKLNFLWDFRYYTKISTINGNNANYIDGQLYLRLWDSASGHADAIKNFSIADYLNSGNIDDNGKRNHLLFFDKDRTTPLPAVCFAIADEWIDIVVKVPLITKYIYFCFTPNADWGSYEGIPDNYLSFDYGMILDESESSDDDWADQKVFNPKRVSSVKESVCSPMDEYNWTEDDEVPNKADHDTSVGNIEPSASDIVWTDGNLKEVFGHLDLEDPAVIGISRIVFDSDHNNVVRYTGLGATDEGPIIAGTTIKFDPSTLGTYPGGVADQRLNLIFGVWDSGSGLYQYQGWSLCLLRDSSGSPDVTKFVLFVSDEWTGGTNYYYTFNLDNEINMNGLSTLTLNIVLAIDGFDDGGETTARLFVQGDDGIVYVSATKDVEHIKSRSSAEFRVGSTNTDWVDAATNHRYPFSIEDAEYTQTYYINGVSISSLHSLFNLANHLPIFESDALGFKYIAAVYLEDLEFDAAGQTIISTAASPDLATIFADADYIVVSNTANNNSHFTIDSLSTNTITCMAGIVNEAGPIDGTIIGFKVNQNIGFGDVEEIKNEDFKNAIMWSKRGGYAFPEEYIRLAKSEIINHITKPSFLLTSNENVMLIGMRNGWEYFDISGGPQNWAGQSIIPELNQYGLLTKTGGQVCGNAFYYWAEIGLVKWFAGNQRVIISRGKIDFLDYLTEEGE